MRPAGGQINLDTGAKNLSIGDGKSRLFGLQDENLYGDAYSQQNSFKGKRILPGSSNTYNNIIGGAYMGQPDGGQQAMMYAAAPQPMQHEMMYYPPQQY